MNRSPPHASCAGGAAGTVDARFEAEFLPAPTLGLRVYEFLYCAPPLSEPELVELGCAIGLTLGQQSWLRMLNIDHHQVRVGTGASMAPGFETAQAPAKSKAAPDYWARKPARESKKRKAG